MQIIPHYDYIAAGINHIFFCILPVKTSFEEVISSRSFPVPALYLLYACSMFGSCLVHIESGIRSYISIEFIDKDFQ